MFQRLFGSIKIRQFALAMMILSLVISVGGMTLALQTLFSIYSQRISQEGRQFAQEEGVSQEIIQTVMDYSNQMIWQLMVTILGFVMLTTILLNLFLDWVSHYLIILPLERIGEKARQISANTKALGGQIEPPLIKEMKTITQAFNQMSIALRNQMDQLEKRVQERTEDLRKARDQMEHMAKHDALTGLPNRWLFDEQFKQSLRVAKRNRSELTLLMIDLDNYKEINDTEGHLVGDEVIKRVGERFAETLRGSDLVSRWGGDEFAILLYDVCQREDVENVVEKIFSAFMEPIEVGEGSFRITMSVGMACYPAHGHEMVSLIKHADAALYCAKEERGHNSVRRYSEVVNGGESKV